MPETYFIAGPTAVGKTAIAVATAEILNAEIVGCDAYQIYQEFPILTAQPEVEVRSRIPHHLIGSLSVSQDFDVAKYLNQATSIIASIHSRGKDALVVGGAGLYMRAVTRGLSELPPPDQQLR